MHEMEVKNDSAENSSGAKDDHLAFWLALFGICISVFSAAISFYSLNLNFLQGPRLNAAAGETLYINGQPLIGMSLTFTNGGARAKVINRLVLEVTGPNIPAITDFEVRSISPSLSSWTYDDKTGRLIEETKVIHSAFDAFQIPGRGETHRAIWFLPDDKDFKFAEGEYAITIKGYGESKDDLALKNDFKFWVGFDF